VKHFAHYIKRTILPGDGKARVLDLPLELPYAEIQPEDQGFRSPAYHSVPINSGVASRVSVGDTIWLFSKILSPWGSLPPSLDGMIRVDDIDKNGRQIGRYRFAAASGSRWYWLFDAARTIRELSVIDARGETRRLLDAPGTAIGQALRFLREIADPAPLIEHAGRVQALAPDFISYRMVDGTSAAFGLAKSLLDNGRAVFWDRWSLPRRLAERDEDVAVVALDSHIVATIESSRVVWGVSSERYAKPGSYSEQERAWAMKVGKFRPYPPWRDD